MKKQLPITKTITQSYFSSVVVKGEYRLSGGPSFWWWQLFRWCMESGGSGEWHRVRSNTKRDVAGFKTYLDLNDEEKALYRKGVKP